MPWGSEVYQLDDYLVQREQAVARSVGKERESRQTVGMAKGYLKGALCHCDTHDDVRPLSGRVLGLALLCRRIQASNRVSQLASRFPRPFLWSTHVPSNPLASSSFPLAFSRVYLRFTRVLCLITMLSSRFSCVSLVHSFSLALPCVLSFSLQFPRISLPFCSGQF
jgi:hypothetical protein